MLENLKSYLGLDTLPQEIQHIMDSSNLRTGRVISVTIMLFEVTTFIVSFFFQVHDSIEQPAQWIFHHRIAYVLMFFAALQHFIYTMTHGLGKGEYSRVKLDISIVLLLATSTLFCIYIAILDYTLGEQVFCFVTVEIFVACLFIIKPYLACILIVSAFSGFYALMTHTIGVSDATNINFPIMGILFLIVNNIRYRQFLRVAHRTEVNRCLTEELLYMSQYDSLTKLKNRHALRTDFEKSLGIPLILMLCDIDDFKLQNDKYGHTHGDKVLERFAAQFQHTFGAEHCYRYGGDEFLVLLPHTSIEDFIAQEKQCRSALGSDFHFSGGYTYGSAVSMEDIRILISNADKNLYKAKRMGKNCTTGGK